MQRITLYYLLAISFYLAHAISDESRELLIDRLNFCCTGTCSLDDITALQLDAQSYLTANKDDALKSMFDKLLFGDRGCRARFYVIMTKRADEIPVVESISIPPININEAVKTFHLVISSPNGISVIYIYGKNDSNFAGYAYITPDGNPTSMNATFPFMSDFYVGEGIFNLTIATTDKDGTTSTLNYADLQLSNLQSTVVYAAGGCNAGYFKGFNSSKPCQACPTGTYSRKDAFVCSSCPAGQGVVGLPGTSCEVCKAGFYSAGSLGCRICPAGTYSQAGSYVCTPCQSGSFSTAGATYCSSCSAGTYACSNGQSICKLCPAGTYTASMGSYYCRKCRPGAYSPQGAISCQLCPEGTFGSESGAGTCTSCRTGFISAQGSTSESSCFEM